MATAYKVILLIFMILDFSYVLDAKNDKVIWAYITIGILTALSQLKYYERERLYGKIHYK